MRDMEGNSSENVEPKFINISKEQEMQVFAKQMLAKRVFIGHYQERRYVSPLNSYRDVVRICDKEEDLKRDLETVKKRLQSFYSSRTWIGITEASMPGAPAGVSIWVTLKDVPLGEHWFQIKEVRFVEKHEILLRLKCLRPVSSETSHNHSTENTNVPKAEGQAEEGEEKADPKAEDNPLADIFSKTIDFIKHIKYDALVYVVFQNCYSLLTRENIKNVVSFFIIMIAASITGFIQFVRYLGDFSLKLTRELSILINACTPLLLGLLDFWSKIVGGFYILLAMLWRDSRRPPPQQGQPLGHPSQLALPPSTFSYRRQQVHWRANVYK